MNHPRTEPFTVFHLHHKRSSTRRTTPKNREKARHSSREGETPTKGPDKGWQKVSSLSLLTLWYTFVLDLLRAKNNDHRAMELEKQTPVTGRTLRVLSHRYNSLLKSPNQKTAVLPWSIRRLPGKLSSVTTAESAWSRPPFGLSPLHRRTFCRTFESLT